ncbi:MAG: type II secretion system F family protein [Acidobacteriota bacterium]|jgi:general secretion pathway protein F|nr:type II secretion system F family protein [Acidobacteriota bacterium]
MTSYNYRASTMEGKIVEGSMDAADDGTVSLKLQEMGLLPIHIGGVGRKTALSRELDWPWKSSRVQSKDVLVFTQELRTLTHAGFPLDRSLAILAQLAESPAMAEIVHDVLKEVKGGKSFSEGLAKYPEVFPKVYVNMVKAGEAGGVLDDILARLETFMESANELRSYIVGALIYPSLLAVVGIFSVVVLTVFVVPRFVTIFSDMGVDLPLPMVVLDTASKVLSGYWWLIALALAAAAYALKRFRDSEAGRLKWDRKMLGVPLLGKVLQKVEIARFSRTLGMLLRGGVPLLHSMTIVRDVINNQSIAKMIEPIRSGIKKGEGIAQPMRQSGVFPPLAMHLVEVGEESGKLDAMLLQVADTYDVEVRSGVKRLVSFFEPALILFMGVVIGTIVVSMLLAIFSINDVPL